jgi:hypothetical protein
MIMGKFRKKPVEVEAILFTGQNYDVVKEFMGVDYLAWHPERGTAISVTIKTLEGDMKAQPNDWIIKGVKGEFYPCKPDIFEATYEAVD